MQERQTAMRQCDPSEPIMIAWNAYKESEAYANTIRWAGKSNEGSLWAAFTEGFHRAMETANAPTSQT